MGPISVKQKLYKELPIQPTPKFYYLAAFFASESAFHGSSISWNNKNMSNQTSSFGCAGKMIVMLRTFFCNVMICKIVLMHCFCSSWLLVRCWRLWYNQHNIYFHLDPGCAPEQKDRYIKWIRKRINDYVTRIASKSDSQRLPLSSNGPFLHCWWWLVFEFHLIRWILHFSI